MNITGYTVDKLEDPTGILIGNRYEFILKLEVPEDDELYSEKGIYLKAIFVVAENSSRIAQYQFFENGTNEFIDFELEEDEEALIIEYCNNALENNKELID